MSARREGRAPEDPGLLRGALGSWAPGRSRREIAELEQRIARLEQRLDEIAAALPVARPAAPTPAPRARVPEPRGNGMRVLLAEPDSAERSAIAVALRQDGYDVVEVGDGADLLRRAGETMASLAASRRRAVIIARSDMPVFAGGDILGFISRQGWSIPVILLGGANGSAATTPGAAAVLGGPVDLDCLRAALRAAIES